MKARRLALTVARVGALPMPVAPEPQVVRRSVAEVRLEQYGNERKTYGNGSEKALHRIALDLRKELSDQRAYEQRLREQHDLDVAAVNRLRSRVAELEAERHVTNEALDDAVQALRANSGQALPWAHAMSDHDLHGFLDDLVSAAMGRWRSEPEVPDRTVLADIEKVCAAWRTPGVGSRLDGSEFDGATVRLAEPEPDKQLKGRARLDASAAADAEATHWRRLGIEEPEGEFYPFLHREGRVPHDMPETGGDGRG
jgi:hypothetical protein